MSLERRALAGWDGEGSERDLSGWVEKGPQARRQVARGGYGRSRWESQDLNLNVTSGSYLPLNKSIGKFQPLC